MGARRTEDGLGSEAWDESEARRSLGELARSGESIAQFARRRRISAQRVYYWKKRLAETGTPAFVAVALAPARVGQIEIVADGVTIRVREDLDLQRIAEIVEVAARRGRGC
jgi:transposase